MQEALLAAAVQWRDQGVPESPRGWLITVASRRLVDQVRSEAARRRREETAAALVPPGEAVAPAPGDEPPADEDDTLTLLFLCCHPALSPASQVALTLRAVGGLTTAEIARAFLVPEATMAQRISRAKQRIKAAGARFGMPPDAERAERLRVVLHVLYLIFNEGYTRAPARDLQRAELTGEAIRLTRAVHELLPDDGEVAGLLALMLLTDARRAARTGPDGALVPLAEQDRGRWDTDVDRRGRRAGHRRRWRAARSARTSCRRRSPPCTTRRRAPRTPTGRRSSPSTSCSSASRRTRWSRSTAPSRWRWCDGPRAGLELARDARRDEPARRPPPPRRGPRAPARAGRRPRRRPRRLPDGGPAHDQPPRAALPRSPRRPAGGVAVMDVITHS